MNGLDLFSGIGGISYALRDYIVPSVYCEIEPYCQSVLLQRMQEGYLSKAPIWDDIRTLSINSSSGEFTFDIIYGGFPCQDISIAGNGKGLEGERSGLFFEVLRLAKEAKPKFIFLENVPAITSRGGLRVVREITEMGYDCRWCVISAASIGALHRRERWFLLAHTKHDGASAGETGRSVRESSSSGKQQQQEKGIWEIERASCVSPHVANTKSKECPGLSSGEKKRQSSIRINSEYATIDEWQKAVCEMGKLSDGVSYYLDRIRALGNAVVPKQAKEAFEILMGIK